MMQAVAIAIGHESSPTTWPDVIKMVKGSNLSAKMQRADPSRVVGADLAMLTRLMKRTKGMDFRGFRCFNLMIKWLDGIEGAARYHFEHSRVIKSENAVWKQYPTHSRAVA